MIPRHENGRLHTGMVFHNAADHCTDECGTGKVCWEHMQPELLAVADEFRRAELQVDDLKKAATHNEEYFKRKLKETEDNADRLNDELSKLAGNLMQNVHDLKGHVGSSPFCMQEPCYTTFQRLYGAPPLKPLPTIDDLLGECRECNRLVMDCGNHSPVPPTTEKLIQEPQQNHVCTCEAWKARGASKCPSCKALED